MKILIAECDTRKAFDVYNMLCQEYNKKCLIVASSNPNFVKNISVFGKKSLQLRTCTENVFIEDLFAISLLYKNEKIVLLPIEEHVVSFFYLFIKRYGKMNFLFMLPEPFSFELSRDKYELNRFCQEKGVASPCLYETEDVYGLSNLVHPLIVKPRHGSGSKGFVFVNNTKELSLIKDLPLEKYVVQELLPYGRNVKGAFFLCDKGKVVACYTHQRIRTYPVQGGVTVFSRFDRDRKVIDVGSKVLEKLNWTGLAMVEMLLDERDGFYKVIEINPRLWGSILLDQFSGAFLLRNYVELSLGREPIKQEIQLDSKIRWLFPFELLNLLLAKGQIPGFWRFDKHTCLINITYSSFIRSFMFHLLYYLKAENYKKFFLKWLR